MQGKKTSHIWSPPPKAYKDIPFSFLFLGWGAKYRIEICPQNSAQKTQRKVGPQNAGKKKYLHCRRYLWGLKSAGGLNYRSTE